VKVTTLWRYTNGFTVIIIIIIIIIINSHRHTRLDKTVLSVLRPLLAVSVCVTVRCPSVCPSVCLSRRSITGERRAGLVCRRSGADGRYRSVAAAGAVYSLSVEGQSVHTVTPDTTKLSCLCRVRQLKTVAAIDRCLPPARARAQQRAASLI